MGWEFFILKINLIHFDLIVYKMCICASSRITFAFLNKSEEGGKFLSEMFQVLKTGGGWLCAIQTTSWKPHGAFCQTKTIQVYVSVYVHTAIDLLIFGNNYSLRPNFNLSTVLIMLIDLVAAAAPLINNIFRIISMCVCVCLRCHYSRKWLGTLGARLSKIICRRLIKTPAKNLISGINFSVIPFWCGSVREENTLDKDFSRYKLFIIIISNIHVSMLCL